MRRPAFLIVLALIATLLSACGNGSGSDGSLPEVKGDYGSKPKITVAKGSKPSKSLESEVLVEGDGKEVAKGDLLVADYLGATYRGTKTFDNSYDRGSPAAFTLKSGAGGVISGWVKALSGTTVGSRVLLVAPPKDGYGKAGNPQAGIKGTDSLVFVVDLIAAYDKKAPLPKSSPATDLADGLPTVAGEADPTLTVPEGTDLPKAPVTTILSEGTGTEVAKGKLIVVQFTAVDWTGKVVSSTWKDGPRGVPVGAEGQPSPFDLLEGVPVGSRVLLQLPPPSGSDASEENLAVVIDILGQHGPAKEKA